MDQEHVSGMVVPVVAPRVGSPTGKDASPMKRNEVSLDLDLMSLKAYMS